MAEGTNISWCDHTFNPWVGCSRVSKGCQFCYAAALPPKMRREAEWGVNGTRVPAPDAYLMKIFKWHRDAVKAGEFRRVFTGSVMDIGEARPELVPLRDAALALVALTPPTKRASDGKLGGLNHLWLTKRPEVLADYFADPALYGRVLAAADRFRRVDSSLGLIPISDPERDLATWYPHLWVGTSVEDQKAADERIPHLLRVPARVRFLSMEPLLGPVDLNQPTCQYCGRWGENIGVADDGVTPWCLECNNEASFGWWLDACADARQKGVNFVIVGGESGRHARPMHPDWARGLRDQCEAAGVPFHFKQFGEHAPMDVDPEAYRHWLYESPEDAPDGKVALVRPDGTVWTPPPGRKAAIAAWEALSIGPDDAMMHKVGKHAAGRTLDGRIWDEFPAEAP